MSAVPSNSYSYHESVEDFFARIEAAQRGQKNHVPDMLEAMGNEVTFSATPILANPTLENAGPIAGFSLLVTAELDNQLTTPVASWRHFKEVLANIEDRLGHSNLSEERLRQLTEWKHLADHAEAFHSYRALSQQAIDSKGKVSYELMARAALTQQLARDCRIYAQQFPDGSDDREIAQNAGAYWDWQRGTQETRRQAASTLEFAKFVETPGDIHSMLGALEQAIIMAHAEAENRAHPARTYDPPSGVRRSLKWMAAGILPPQSAELNKEKVLFDAAKEAQRLAKEGYRLTSEDEKVQSFYNKLQEAGFEMHHCLRLTNRYEVAQERKERKEREGIAAREKAVPQEEQKRQEETWVSPTKRRQAQYSIMDQASSSHIIPQLPLPVVANFNASLSQAVEPIPVTPAQQSPSPSSRSRSRGHVIFDGTSVQTFEEARRAAQSTPPPFSGTFPKAPPAGAPLQPLKPQQLRAA